MGSEPKLDTLSVSRSSDITFSSDHGLFLVLVRANVNGNIHFPSESVVGPAVIRTAAGFGLDFGCSEHVLWFFWTFSAQTVIHKLKC